MMAGGKGTKTPFEVDQEICELVRSSGLLLIRLPHRVRIENPDLIPESCKKKMVDKTKIAQLLREGTAVPGATLEDGAWLIAPDPGNAREREGARETGTES